MAYSNLSNINELFGVLGQVFTDSMGSTILAGAVFLLIFVYYIYKNRGGFLGVITLGTCLISLLAKHGYLPEIIAPLMIIVGGTIFGAALVKVTRN